MNSDDIKNIEITPEELRAWQQQIERRLRILELKAKVRTRGTFDTVNGSPPNGGNRENQSDAKYDEHR